MKILIADDDRVVRMLLVRIARQFADEILEAADGLAAIRIIERDDPDLVITDLRMPVVDGFQLVEAVRHTPYYAHLPIVCISSVSERDDIAALATLGIGDYVLKPLRPADVVDRVRAVIQRSARWKDGRFGEPANAAAKAVLVIDPDPSFHAFIGSVLSPTYHVAGATSGADGLSAYRTRTPSPSVVLVSDGLALLNAARVAELLRQFAAERRVDVPTVLFVRRAADGSETTEDFDGVVDRTRDPADFARAVSQWLPTAT